MQIDISTLIGLTLSSVENYGGEQLILRTTEGRVFRFYHIQDCCETVRIESIVGDLQDLVGSPLLIAEAVRGETPSGYKFEYEFEYEPESVTWTFYKFATAKGYVDIRWLGESNGYYSEEVDFEEVTN